VPPALTTSAPHAYPSRGLSSLLHFPPPVNSRP